MVVLLFKQFGLFGYSQRICPGGAKKKQKKIIKIIGPKFQNFTLKCCFLTWHRASENVDSYPKKKLF